MDLVMQEFTCRFFPQLNVFPDDSTGEAFDTFDDYSAPLSPTHGAKSCDLDVFSGVTPFSASEVEFTMSCYPKMVHHFSTVAMRPETVCSTSDASILDLRPISPENCFEELRDELNRCSRSDASNPTPPGSPEDVSDFEHALLLPAPERVKLPTVQTAKKRKRPPTSPTEETGDGVVKAHVYHAAKATAKPKSNGGIGEQRTWFCGYCGYKKISASASTDGVIRIRCPCGGVHADKKNRMHSNWTQTPGVADIVVEGVVEEGNIGQVCHASGFKPILTSRHRPHNMGPYLAAKALNLDMTHPQQPP